MSLDPTIDPLNVAQRIFGVSATCGCFSCLSNYRQENGLSITASFMVLCRECGNKRCPKATHHDNACTGSNATGQTGSRYA